MLLRFTKRSHWTLLSVIMVLSFGNFALELVHAQILSLGSPHDNSLSPEASFPYTNKRFPSKLGLGSAAISSVTSALSPILPFTGGVDLRREELWSETSWLRSATNVVHSVRDAFGLGEIPRGGSQHVKKPTSALKVKEQRPKTEYVSTISSQKPFLSLSKIADFTLSDMTHFFQYALHNHRPGFSRDKFVGQVNDRVRPTLDKVDAAAATSRGKDVLPALTHKEGEAPLEYGDIDALQFCAAMRIFAEWRVLRQVPDGYKGYAVGMNLGHKDIVQNLYKIETKVHEWIEYRREQVQFEQAWNSDDIDELRAPTLRELLEHEADIEAHSRLPRLKEKTAAMGLLWVRRQLHYQTSIFNNILQVPRSYATSKDAVSAAYSEVYGNYHGWAVQKIFNYSFQAAPRVEEIFKFMNPHRLRQVKDDARRMVSSKNPVVVVAASEFKGNDAPQDQPDMNALERFGNHLVCEWDKFGKHVGGEWDKLMDAVVRVFDQDTKSSTMRGGYSASGLEGDELDKFITERMAQDAHEHIVVYLESVQPLLQDLAGLFHDLNMDDPTKV